MQKQNEMKKMALRPAALLTVGLLLLLVHGAFPNEGIFLFGNVFVCLRVKRCICLTLCTGPASLPIRLTVENDLFNLSPESYSCSTVEGGVLLGALRRLQEAKPGFR